MIFANALGKGESVAECKKMTDSTATLSSCQANVLGISRHRDYYRPHALWDADLKLMHRVNKLHMGIPFASNLIL